MGIWGGTNKPPADPRKCSCGMNLDIRRVHVMDFGPVDLGICPMCDLHRCTACNKPAHELNERNARRCQHCRTPI